MGMEIVVYWQTVSIVVIAPAKRARTRQNATNVSILECIEKTFGEIVEIRAPIRVVPPEQRAPQNRKRENEREAKDAKRQWPADDHGER